MIPTETAGVSEAEARIDHAAAAIRGMTHDMVDELPLRPWVTNTLRNLTIKAPLSSLAIAFLLGVIVARRG